MAIVRKSAAIMGDKELFLGLNDALTTSIANAKKSEAKAEYALAILDNQLALEIGKQIKLDLRSSSALERR